MRSHTLRIAVVALFLFGAALGFSYTIEANTAHAAENCNCYAQFDCPASCNKGGQLYQNPLPPYNWICGDTGSGACAICKCY